ncbi:MAG: sigma-54-dependent Fis family transcriptional regulator [Alphaproteobacteria bacterium]|nr:sigma-54-dependent Fis family transcriptional regulator [Myxococcales bacterium]MCB9686031.1 sigma-54-dependent Fis family transcriptional regulator [Alphaproteobacteria bacterium]MCB9699978.1 sigma-54-dependent Fis family transcriptional regulator [Alphaproteobacteria bacterium]
MRNTPEPCRRPLDPEPKLCQLCQLRADTPGLTRCSRLVVRSEAMRDLLVRAGPIARSGDVPVVILGETGAGKEVLARTLHANSPRADKPLIAINVAALPADLVEAELFGHEKGAFTGATAARQGLFEAADGGTLLLDEIGELPLAAQAKILRVLDRGEVRRVGSTRERRVDVRIFCATNRDLANEVRHRRFREDLYWRLKVFELTVPPLRERPEDILPLARMFLSELDHATGRFTDAARELLERHHWPGNVRELANAVQHGAVLSEGSDIDLGHLPEDLGTESSSSASTSALHSLAEVERAHILRVLEAVGGHQGEAAQILGIGRTTLWRKLRDLDEDVGATD